MERFEIEFSKKAAKAYNKLPKNYKTLIDLALSRLEQGLPTDLTPVIGEENIYRVRVGKYPIIFEIDGRVLLIIRIGSRGDVYKK